jgi:hypothetical protein
MAHATLGYSYLHGREQGGERGGWPEYDDVSGSFPVVHLKSMEGLRQTSP